MAHTGYYSDLSSFANVDQALAQAQLYRDQSQAAAEAADVSEDNAAESENKAAASALDAQTSATAAGNSAVNASNSADAALDSATIAVDSSQDAEASASTAATQATNASNSATAAAGSATAAQTSATAAAGSATAAATSATNATTQATNANNSATAAATSELNATAAAGSAQSSATAAGTSATAAAGSASSAQTSATNASTSATAAAGSASASAQSAADALNASQGAAVPMFTVLWNPSRTSIPAGYVAADGQLLNRATYPAAWSGINANNVPVVSDSTWISDPHLRASYSTGNGSSTFRVPDYNGQSSGSLGSTFLRGDGALSSGVIGRMQRDSMRDHIHPVLGGSGTTQATSGTFGLYGGSAASVNVNGDTADDSYHISGSRSPKSLIGKAGDVLSQSSFFNPSETRPLNATGCWIVKLYGAVTNTGSADAAQLASDLANLSGQYNNLQGRVTNLEGYYETTMSWTAGGDLTVTHNLGKVPKLIQFELITLAAVNGQPAGAVIGIVNGINYSAAGSNWGVEYRNQTTTKVDLKVGSSGFAFSNAAGSFSSVTNTQAALKVKVWGY